MKEKFKTFMVQGGLVVIIAVVAMSLYLTAMYFGNKYFEKATEPAKLTVNEEGIIYLDGFEKEKSENIYIMWETDAGNISPVDKSEIFEDDTDSLGYVVNTNYNEKIKWSNKDSNGLTYEEATVRAVVYSYEENSKEDIYYMGNYVNEYTITVKSTESVIKKSDDRFFGNPVRQNSSKDWSEIYPVEESNGRVSYRYRTGNDIDEKNIVLCWESDKNVLMAADYEKGINDCKTVSEEKSTALLGNSIITINSDEETTLKAYLVSEDVYNAAKEDINIEEKDKYNIAELVVSSHIN